MVIDKNEIVAWYTDFIRDEKRFFVIIVSSRYRGIGIGSNLLSRAKKNYSELNGWIVLSNQYKLANGKPYLSPWKFYQKNGFELHEQIRSGTNVLDAVLIKWRK